MTSHYVYFIIFASIGVAVEVTFTAMANFRMTKDLKLQGRSYIWMLPIYGMAYPLLLFSDKYFFNVPLFVRGFGYVLLLYIIEYLSGWLIMRLTGKCPWEDDYKNSKYSVNNLIRLDFFPAWYVLTILLDRLYVFLK